MIFMGGGKYLISFSGAQNIFSLLSFLLCFLLLCFFFDPTISKGHESTALPRLSTFTGLIHAWARVDPRRAADILNHIVSLGMKPPPNVYAKIISAWAEAGHAAKGEALFTSMLSAGNRPDPSCCRAVLRGLCAFHAEPVERESRGMRATQIVNIILQSGGALDEPMVSD